MTCVVRELGDASVVWKKWESGKSGPKILSAGEVRVTSDERMTVIHDQGELSSQIFLQGNRLRVGLSYIIPRLRLLMGSNVSKMLHPDQLVSEIETDQIPGIGDLF